MMLLQLMIQRILCFAAANIELAISQRQDVNYDIFISSLQVSLYLIHLNMN